MATLRHIKILVATLITASVGCGSGDSADGGTASTFACDSHGSTYHYCTVSSELTAPEVTQLTKECMNSVGSTVLDSCPTENLVGTCVGGTIEQFDYSDGQSEMQDRTNCAATSGTWTEH
jgi:hypothetical protein